MTGPMKDGDSGGPMKRQCTAIANGTGQRCLLPPILGGTCCHKHGGSAPQVRRAAVKRVAEEQVRVLYEKYEPYQPGPGPVDYGAALEYHVGRLAHVADFLEHQVAALTPEEWQAADLTRVQAVVGMAQTAQRTAAGALLDVAKLGTVLRELEVWRDRRQAEFGREQSEMVCAVLELVCTEMGWPWECEAVYAVLAEVIRRVNEAHAAGHPIRPHGWQPDPPPARPPGDCGVTWVGAPGSATSLWSVEEAAESRERWEREQGSRNGHGGPA